MRRWRREWRRGWRRRRHWRRRGRRWRVVSAQAVPIQVSFARCRRGHVRIEKVDSIEGWDKTASGRNGRARTDVQSPSKMRCLAFALVLGQVSDAVRVLLGMMRLNWRWGWRIRWRMRGRIWRRGRRNVFANKDVRGRAKRLRRGDVSIRVAAQARVALFVAVKQIFTLCRAKGLDRFLIGDIAERRLDFRAEFAICKHSNVDSATHFLAFLGRRKWRRRRRWR